MLSLSNASFRFSPSKVILDNQTITFRQGEIHALMGANGSGKTTLINLFTGFIKLQSGTIIANNTKINKFPPFRINKLGIARTFQNLRLATHLTVFQNLELACTDFYISNWFKVLFPKQVYKREYELVKNNISQIASQFHLIDLGHEIVQELSFGQQKLLSIACCVANGATLLLLDEPVAGINPEYRKNIAKILLALKKEGKTIILIEHNIDFIEQVADNIYFLYNGEITCFPNVVELRNSSKVINAYL